MAFGVYEAFTVGSLVAVFALAQPAQAQDVMPASAIQKMLGGKRVTLTCIDGTSGRGRYVMARNFGTIAGTYQRPGRGPENDVGRVRANGDQLCLKFRALNGGQDRCFNVRQETESTFAFTALGGIVRVCEVTAL